MRGQAALIAILLLAGGLRFWRLDWGLRHHPDPDERVFVENAAVMAAYGGLDHRYYEYPALVFDLLAPLLRLRGTSADPDPGAYLWARGLVAAFGVASVALVYVLGRRSMGVAGGLAGALFLAVSPVEVSVAHMVRPDVILETFALLTLWALSSVGASAAADARAGLALGLANGVKFSGALLLPSALVAWALAPRRRGGSLLLIAAVAAVAFLVVTPYALLHYRDFVAGASVQVSYHYGRETSYLTMLGLYLAVLPRALGPPAFLALVALPLLRREWRVWAPALVFPLVCILVFSTSGVRRERFLVPCLGVVALLAGRAVAGLARRSSALALALTLAAAAPPLAESLLYLRNLSRSLTLDRVADFIVSEVPLGSTMLTFVPELDVDPARYEVVPWKGAPSLASALVRNVDYVVIDPRRAALLGALEPTFRAEPASREEGGPLAVYRVPEAAKLRYAPLSLRDARLEASEAGGDVDHVRDGRVDTAWATAGPQRRGQFLEVVLPSPAPIGRVLLIAGRRPSRRGARLAILATEDGRTWSRAPSTPAPVGHGNPGRQAFLLDGASIRGVRIVPEGGSDLPWAVAELVLEVPASGEEGAAGGD